MPPTVYRVCATARRREVPMRQGLNARQRRGSRQRASVTRATSRCSVKSAALRGPGLPSLTVGHFVRSASVLVLVCLDASDVRKGGCSFVQHLGQRDSIKTLSHCPAQRQEGFCNRGCGETGRTAIWITKLARAGTVAEGTPPSPGELEIPEVDDQQRGSGKR